MPPRQLQLAGTASSSVGIGWYHSRVNDVRPDGPRRRDCNRGSIIGICLSTDWLTAGSTTECPPVFAELSDCCWSELTAAEELEGSA